LTSFWSECFEGWPGGGDPCDVIGVIRARSVMVRRGLFLVASASSGSASLNSRLRDSRPAAVLAAVGKGVVVAGGGYY